MRVLSASVVVSSMVLGGWLAAAKAQNLDLNRPPALNQGLGGLTNETLPGQISQPGLESPGLITGVTLGQVFTDNLRLVGSQGRKQAGVITQIQPFVRGATDGPRFSGLFDYRLSGDLYEKPSGRHQLAQDLNARGTLTLLPQHFFLDGTALYTRQIINNQLPYGSGEFFLGNNRANVAIGSLSPHWQQDLGRAGVMTLRYIYGRLVYNDRGIPGENRGLLNGIPDVTSNAVQFSLTSPQNQTWGWDFDYSEQRLDPDFGPHWDFAVAKMGTSFQVNSYFKLLADGGRANKFLPDGTVQKLGATFWDVGFQWANTRDNFKVMAGHQFFGHSYQLSWTHEAALLITDISYTERPTTYDQQLLGMGEGGAGALPPINIHPEIPSLKERHPYLMKRLAASLIYLMPQSRFRVTVYDESRTFFTQGNTREQVKSVDLSWPFELGPFTTLAPSFNWGRYQFRDGQTNNNRYAQLALVHQIDVKNFGSVRLRHDRTGVSSASQGAHGYTVNVLFIQWTHLF